MDNIIKTIVRDLKIKEKPVRNTVRLLNDGNTIPFIARYRKEQTGGLDETQLREINEKNEYLKKLILRKEEIKSILKKKNKLNTEIIKKLDQVQTLQEAEDIYRPFKEKRETRATKAIEQGLKPLADYISEGNLDQQIEKKAEDFVSEEKDIYNIEDAVQGAFDIVADKISNNSEVRKTLRAAMKNNSILTTKKKKSSKDIKNKYEAYYEYREEINKIPDHSIMAIDRGENEDIINVNILHEREDMYKIIKDCLLSEGILINSEIIIEIIMDAFKRLIEPSLNKELRNYLTDKAQKKAISIFKENLRSLLLSSPYKNHKILGIDPGFKSGCKVAVIDEMSDFITNKTIYPHPPQNEKERAKEILIGLLKKYEVDTIAIGNGTASRETESFVSNLPIDKIKYIIVNEAGASVYSASQTAIQEFPDLDVSVRGAISIARRLQDPLSELVKIDPRSIGVGQYQHDVNQSLLKNSLKEVVESVVNQVGVNLNTASASLLRYVSGINSTVAHNMIRYRQTNGEFSKRDEIKEVYGVGAKTFEQSSGFLRFFSRNDPFAYTSIHPESYKEAELVLKEISYSPHDILDKEKLNKLRKDIEKIDKDYFMDKYQIDRFTLRDIIKNLKKPGIDPRDQLPDPMFKNEIMAFEDLEVGMNLKGTVRNVVDFGAFVDIGIKQSGLIHISELSHKYINHPLDVISVGDIVLVKIIFIDKKRKRISLSRKL